jgi:hypothetical protein
MSAPESQVQCAAVVRAILASQINNQWHPNKLGQLEDAVAVAVTGLCYAEAKVTCHLSPPTAGRLLNSYNHHGGFSHIGKGERHTIALGHHGPNKMN